MKHYTAKMLQNDKLPVLHPLLKQAFEYTGDGVWYDIEQKRCIVELLQASRTVPESYESAIEIIASVNNTWLKSRKTMLAMR